MAVKYHQVVGPADGAASRYDGQVARSYQAGSSIEFKSISSREQVEGVTVLLPSETHAIPWRQKQSIILGTVGSIALMAFASGITGSGQWLRGSGLPKPPQPPSQYHTVIELSMPYLDMVEPFEVTF
jgi:hypothetical protein